MRVYLFSALLLISYAVSAQVLLTGFEYQGAGCPQGHVNVAITSDASAFSILYDSFNLQAGGNITAANSACSVVLHLKKPKRLGFKVTEAEFRGFVALDASVIANQNVVVMSGPNHGHQKLSAEFGTQNWSGPIAENYSLRSVKPTNKKPPVLDCVPPKENTDIIVDSKIQISNAGLGKFGQLTVDSVDGLIEQKFSIQWIDCSK